MSSAQLTARLPAAATVLADLRCLLNELLAGGGVARSHRHDALLVAHELAANAIEHGSEANDEIEIRCSITGNQLILVVLDNARSGSTPIAYTPQVERARGRGLYLVDRLTDSWIETIIGGRRHVTARLTLDANS
jgi:anti-sigma regulatory factor (Ser/Thr protein kinase)